MGHARPAAAGAIRARNIRWQIPVGSPLSCACGCGSSTVAKHGPLTPLPIPPWRCAAGCRAESAASSPVGARSRRADTGSRRSGRNTDSPARRAAARLKAKRRAFPRANPGRCSTISTSTASSSSTKGTNTALPRAGPAVSPTVQAVGAEVRGRCRARSHWKPAKAVATVNHFFNRDLRHSYEPMRSPTPNRASEPANTHM